MYLFFAAFIKGGEIFLRSQGFMAENNKVKFFKSEFKIEHLEHVFELTGLVSEYGVTKLHVVSRPPPFIDSAFGHAVKLVIGSHAIDCVLVKHSTVQGTSYDVRFINLDDEQKQFLYLRLEQEGVLPGWVRKYPRISVKQALSKDLPSLNFCVLRFLGAENFTSALNFTLDGIRVEAIGEQMADARVGAAVHLDLMTNTGQTMENFPGEIRNFSVHHVIEDGKRKVSRSIGIKLGLLELEQKRQYGMLIRDHCQALIKQVGKDA